MKFIGKLLESHLARYPRMELVDIYKLLHQAALGSSHAVDSLAARERLEQETAALGEGPDEPLIDPISPDGKLARVHLRPYVAARRDLDALSRAFIRTATDYPASSDTLARFCACLADLVDEQRLPAQRDQVARYVSQLADSGYPAVRHSAIYHELYQPAYRVISIDYLS